MKKQPYTILLILSCYFMTCPFSFIAQNWGWAATAGGIYNDKATDLDIDKAGDLYVSGYYNVGQPASTTANFGSIVANPGNWGKEGFLAKISSNGTWTWVNSAVGGYDERVLGLCVDNVNGFVYATGTTWTWNPNDLFMFGPCNVYNNPGSADEIFVAKFDLNGNCQWMIGAGTDGDDHGYDVITDKQGNIFLTGFLSDHYGTFGSPGQFGSIVVPMNTDSIAYLAKISPAGVFQWVVTFDGLEGERDNRVAVDTLGDVYVTGGYKGTKTFGTTTLTSAGGYDIFVLKYGSNGNFLFAQTAGSTLDDRGNSITVDKYLDMYVTGEFRDHAVFGTDTINNNGGPGGRDIFVAKMKTNGNWVWAKKAGSNGGSDRGDRIVASKTGAGLYVTGQFKGNAAFGSSISLTATAADSIQVFVAAIDTAGKWKWALSGGSTHEDRGTGVACDTACNVYGCGYYETSATFGGSTVSGPGQKEAFVAQITNACISSLAVNTTNVSCNGLCNGSATAFFSSVGTYTWSTNPVQNTSTATGLCPGVYTLTVADTLGTTYTQTVSITEPAVLGVTLSSVSNASCNAVCSGSAAVTASGGSPAYSYAWNTTPVQTNSVAVGLCAGNYTCMISDSYSCAVTQTVSITEPPAINTSVNTTNIICNGACTGSASVNVSGGVPNYTYSWNTFPVQTTSSLANVCAGNYSCTVTDASGCIKVAPASITQPTPITATAAITPISCSGASNASATLTVSGGNGTYIYYWSNFQNTNPVSGLAAGNYSVVVEDITGCQETFTVTIADVAPTDSLAMTASSCIGDPTLQLSAPTVTGAPYQWYLSNSAVAGATGISYLAITANANLYSVTWVHQGCTYISSTLLQTIYPDLYKLPQTNIFTPNGDLINDEFHPLSAGPTVSYAQLQPVIEEYELFIFDRWGVQMFSTTDIIGTWKGTDKNGSAVSAGTYYWMLRFRSKCASSREVQSIKGFVQLIR